MRNRIASVLLLSVGLLTACGGGKEPTSPNVDRSAVAGIYHLATLTFDPKGSAKKSDILSRMSLSDHPELSLSHTDDRFTLLFRDAVGGFHRIVEGKYTPLGDQVRLEFGRAEDAERLLLPKRIEFDFDKDALTISYAANTAVSLRRLEELDPEYRREQLRDPVLGELVVIFTLDRR